MAASTAGALKAYIEAGGLALAAYRDAAPKDAAYPHVLIHEAIALVPSLANARYDRAGTAPAGLETVQVSLWQRWRDASGAMAESYGLADDLASLLDGAGLADAPTHVWGVRLVSSVRLLDTAKNLVQHAITVEVVRDF